MRDWERPLAVKFMLQKRYSLEREEKLTKKEECPERDLRVEALDWLGWLDLNQRNDGVKVRCLTPWRQPNI